jgi:hypothetical protein
MSKPSTFRDSTGVEPFAVRFHEGMRLSGLGRSEIYEGLNDGSIEGVKNGRITLLIVESLKRKVLSLPRYDRNDPPPLARAMILTRKTAAESNRKTRKLQQQIE